jgi:hypothetical protein
MSEQRSSVDPTTGMVTLHAREFWVLFLGCALGVGYLSNRVAAEVGWWLTQVVFSGGCG